jgi:hypothetical protein
MRGEGGRGGDGRRGADYNVNITEKKILTKFNAYL